MNMSVVGPLFAVLVIGMSGSASAVPWGMAKNAEIGEVDGLVSICLPESDPDAIEVDSVWVTENRVDKGAERTVWDVEKPAAVAPVSLKPGECLRYGAKLPGYKVNVSARELEVGVTYSIRLNRFIENPKRTSTLFYTAVFCSVTRGGKNIYLPYRYEPDGRVLKPKCDGQGE